MRIKELGSLSDSKETLTLQLPSTGIQLSTKDLERLIVDLIGFRQLMLPVVTPQPQQDEMVPTVRDPLWGLTPSVGGTQFHMFYPGLGWLFFVFSKEQISALAKAVSLANIQPPDPSQTRQ
jgi:hypothetical protein